MPSKIRRVVTGHDAQGKSIVFDDRVLPEATRVGIWFTGPGPSKNDDDRALEFHPTKLEPPPGGSTLRINEAMPKQGGDSLSFAEKKQQARQRFRSMDAEHCLVDSDRYAGMHRSKTTDYILVLQGELTLILDDGEAVLKAGDVVIQRGTSHAWENRGTALARWYVIMIDAETHPHFRK